MNSQTGISITIYIRNKSDYIEISSFHWIIEIDLILASSIFSYIFKTLLVDLKSNLPYLKDIKKVSSTFAMGLKLMPGDHPLVKLKYHVIKALSKSLDLIFMFVDISMTFSNVLENSGIFYNPLIQRIEKMHDFGF